GTAGYTTAHDGRNLWNALRADDGIITEYAPKVIFVGKDLILHGQIYAGRIYQIQNGQMIFDGNLLRPEIFLSCYREPGPGFYRSIISNNDAVASGYLSNSYNYPTGGAASLLIVHFIACPNSQFIKRRIYI